MISWLAVLLLLADAGARVTGVVVDAGGAPVAGAQVVVMAGSESRVYRTDSDGRFEAAVRSEGEVEISVEAAGFAPFRTRRRPKEETGPLVITLRPPAFSERVTVTATRTETRLGKTATGVTVLSSDDLAAAAAPTVDDVLRQAPGFSLFRRSGSRTANPTSQGASLRGLGASGASRALVLDDGVPLNDPFGGWVYWGRVPRASIDRLEVMRGGGSDLYGSGALGGVVHLLRRAIENRAMALEGSFGSEESPEASLFASGRVGAWGASVAAEAFRTNGYVAVDERERGPVDTRVASRHATADLTIERLMGERGRLFARGSYFEEWRDNGTPLQRNNSRIRQLAAGGEWQSSSAGSLALHFYRSGQLFHQSFSAVAPDRSSERLTAVQTVPSDAAGAAAEWRRRFGAHTLVAGLEARTVSASMAEEEIGGRQRNVAFFAEDLVLLSPRLSASAALRLDRWRDDGAHCSAARFGDRSETVASPRASLVYEPGQNVALAVSAYRAFRAPTLNELYRPFRVGNVLTLANENLRAERLSGVELGGTLSSASVAARAALFWMEVDRPIANVTLSATPALITRQRENLGRTRSRGVEVESQARFGARLAVSVGYLYADSSVTSFSANPGLEGRRLPQVPRYQATLQIRSFNPKVASVGLQARLLGAQFDDDQNRFRLGSFWTLDLRVSRALSGGVEVFAAAENIFEKRYEIGRTPVRTLGAPRLIRGGLRLALPTSPQAGQRQKGGSGL